MTNFKTILVRLLPFLIPLVSIYLFISNYQQGYYLIGWDNVLPELNFKLNLQRSLFSVWQNYRGLGTYDGMAHAANLTHTIYTWIISLFAPQNAIRYIFLLITHALGGLGMFYFTQSLRKKFSIHASLFAALFYMLNIGIIQMYFAPLEVFAIHFMALPWLTLSFKNALESFSKKSLGILLLTSVIFSGQGFVPTVFVVAFLFLGILAFSYVITHKTFEALKRGIIILALVLVANSFWLLPFINGLSSTTQEIQNSRINILSSERLFERNKSRGDITDVLYMKGFMLDTPELDTMQNKTILFMEKWNDLTHNPIYILAFTILISIGFIGIYSIFADRENNEYIHYGILGGYILALLFLANNTPILNLFQGFLRSTIPTLAEAFRIPFTKFITLYAFTFSMCLGLGIQYVGDFFRRKYTRVAIVIIIIFSMLAISYPAFTGNFFSPLLRVELPEEYRHTFEFFKSKPKDSRIAILPLQSFWNWQYRDFGQRGSGFLWYGIEQPILLRAFDPWSTQNEQAFNELSYAFNYSNISMFEKALEKYDIQYLVLDEHFIANGSKSINYENIEHFLSESENISLEEEFGNIIIYSYNNTQAHVTVGTYENIPKISKEGKYNTSEIAPISYINTTPEDANIKYLFGGWNDFGIHNAGSQIESNSSGVTVTSNSIKMNPITQSTYDLNIPSMYRSEYLIPVKFELSNNSSIIVSTIYPRLTINGTMLNLQTESIEIPTTFRSINKIHLPDISKEISYSQSGYLLNNYVNSIQFISNEGIQTSIIDTSKVKPIDNSFKLSNDSIYNASVFIDSHDDILRTVLFNNDANTISIFSPRESGCSDKKNEKPKYQDSKIVFHTACGDTKLGTYVENTPHNAGYLIDVEYKYIDGLSPSFFVSNTQSQRSEIETQFSRNATRSYVVLPPTENVFKGYGFEFVTRSVSTKPTQIELYSGTVRPFPTEWLQNIYISSEKLPASNLIESIEQDNMHFASVIPASEVTFASLSEAYNKGWHAYIIDSNGIMDVLLAPFFGTKIDSLDHVMIDSWKQGWKIPENTQSFAEAGPRYLAIIFLPQYLQFAGFGLILVALLLIANKKT